MIQDKTPRLNVVIHGIGIVYFDYSTATPTVTVRSPTLTGDMEGMHVYRLRSLDATQGFPHDNDIEGKTCVLSGVKANSPIASAGVSGSGAICVSATKTDITGWAKNGPGFCGLAGLPLPDQLWVFRNTAINDFDSNGSTYKGNDLGAMKHLPLLVVLGYEGVDLQNPPTVSIASGVPQVIKYGTDNVARLHIYTEPATPPTDPAHSAMAFKVVNTLVQQNMDLAVQSEPPNPYPDWNVNGTGHSSVLSAETKSLVEIANANAPKPPHTCLQVVVVHP
jgi:hypothetical protein